MNKTLVAIIVIVILIIGGWVIYQNQPGPATGETIKIGVITDLTGPAAAYWGESTKIGAEMAIDELKKSGVPVELVIEDYQLDAAKAASAAQKLVNIDKVNALYVEFNPGAVAVGSVVKDKNIPMIYDAAITSPLKDSPYFYKTYLDYEDGCQKVAQEFKDAGVAQIGMLKINIEAGELCLNGVKRVFSNNQLFTTGFNLGDTDFRTQILKIKQSGAQALISVGFEGDTFNALKVVRDFGYKMPYGTVADTVTPKVVEAFPDNLKGGFAFGFSDVGSELRSKLDRFNGSAPTSYNAAALAYLHVKQLAIIASECKNDLGCVQKKMAGFTEDREVGFLGFNGQVAELDTKLFAY